MSDSMETTVLRVEPNGKVRAVFSGHLEAQGLDLPLHPRPEKALEDDKARWLRSTDGAVVGEIYAFEDPTFLRDALLLQIQAQAGNHADLTLVSRDVAGK